MRPKTIVLTMAALDRNGIFLSARPAGAGAITLDGAYVTGGVAILDVPRSVAVYAGTDESTVVFTITGTNRYGQTITDTVTGVNATTVATTKNFKTVTGVSCATRPSDVIEVGTYSSMKSQIIPTDGYITYTGNLSSGASMLWKLEYTLDNVLAPGYSEDSGNWNDAAGVLSVTGSSSSEGMILGLRAVITSYVSGSLTLSVINSK